MPSPFPGMNPYLENRELWPEFHHWIITAIAELLAPQLRPKYRVAVEKRVYQMTDENFVLVGIPDVVVSRSLTNPEPEKSTIAVASPPTKPLTVRLMKRRAYGLTNFNNFRRRVLLNWYFYC